MTRLIDVHAPQHGITETLVLHVDAAPDAVLAAADRLDLARDPFAGVTVLGSARAQRVFGLSFDPKPGAAGRVDVVWDISVTGDVDDGCYLSSTRRFTATDDDARDALRDSWRTVRANADTIARQTLGAIKRAAEETAVPMPAELLLAA